MATKIYFDEPNYDEYRLEEISLVGERVEPEELTDVQLRKAVEKGWGCLLVREPNGLITMVGGANYVEEDHLAMMLGIETEDLPTAIERLDNPEVG